MFRSQRGTKKEKQNTHTKEPDNFYVAGSTYLPEAVLAACDMALN